MSDGATKALAAAVALFAVCVLGLRHRPDLRVPLTRPALSRYLQGVVTSGPRWTTATTQVFLHGADGISGTLLLRFKPHPSLGRDVTVGISQEGRLVGEIRPRRKMRTYRVPVESAPTLGPWLEPVPLEVRCDQYAKFWNGEEVCVRLEGIAFEPTPGGITSTKATMWRGACLAWSFLLLAWCVRVATRRLGRFARQALLATLASVWLVLAAWAHLRPYELAWWLPPTPVALAGLSFAALLWSGGSLPRVPRLALPAGYAFLGASLALAGWSPEAAAAMIFVGLLWLALCERAEDDGAPEPTKRGVTLVLLLIVTVAAAVRLYRLDDLPFGMWRDEARHGLIALRMIEEPSYRPTYVAESNVNLPAFGLYLLAVGVKLFGIDYWTMRPVTALAGIVTTVVVYFGARHLLGSRWQALVASSLVMASSWHIWQSRNQFPTIFDPLFTWAGLLLLLGAHDKARPGARYGGLLAAGFVLGLAAQTYHSGRVSLVIGTLLLACLGGTRGVIARRTGALLAGGVVALLPIAWSVASQPGALNRRVDQVALVPTAAGLAQAPVAALDRSVGQHLAMFNLRGDENGRRNLPGRSMLDGFTGLGFLAGAGWLVSRKAPARQAFLLIALGVGLLPSALAIDGPHGMRAVGALVPACLIGALGWSRIARCLAENTRLLQSRIGFFALAAGLPLLSLVVNVHVYFRQAPLHPAVWRAYYPVHTQVGRHLRELARTEPKALAIVPEALLENSVLGYLSHGLPFGTYGPKGFSIPVRAADRIVVPGGARRLAAAALVLRHAPLAVKATEGPPFPGTTTPTFEVFRLPD